MVAIQHPTALPAPCALPARPAAPRRPTLRVLEGGRSPRRLAATYRRRRLAVLAVTVVVVVLALVGAASLLGAVRAHVQPGASVAAAPAVATVVAAPGDTLWSIAERLPHHGDVRVLVDRLVALNGGTQVRAGQAVRVPAR